MTAGVPSPMRAPIQAGIEYERGQVDGILGQIDYTLVGLPVSLTYDSTDDLLDPTRGFRVLASVAPYPSSLAPRSR